LKNSKLLLIIGLNALGRKELFKELLGKKKIPFCPGENQGSKKNSILVVEECIVNQKKIKV